MWPGPANTRQVVDSSKENNEPQLVILDSAQPFETNLAGV